MSSRSFKDLLVWQKSMVLVKDMYYICSQLPESEKFSLSSQMKRSAISIASNIAEGSKRSSKKDFNQFLRIAYGSSAELETQLLVTQMIYQNIKVDNELDQIQEIQKMLASIIRKFSNT